MVSTKLMLWKNSPRSPFKGDTQHVAMPSWKKCTEGLWLFGP